MVALRYFFEECFQKLFNKKLINSIFVHSVTFIDLGIVTNEGGANMKKIETLNRTKIAYQEEGQGLPIILIHGLDGNLAAFHLLKQQLQTQYRVITYDVRGHGKSSHPNSYNLADHVKDLYILMTKLNLQHAHILGHDMGGIIAREFTEKYEDKVLSLTIISSKAEDIVHGFTKLMIEHQDEIAGFNKSEALLLLFPYIFKEREEAMKWFQRQRLYSKQCSEDSAIASRALLDTVNGNREFSRSVKVPTLIINGRYDPIIGDKEHYKLEERFQNVEKVLFEESGHAPYVEEEGRFLSIYLDFLENVEHITKQND